MSNKFKAFGLALVAVFAMSAVAASAASATNFTAAEYPVDVTASQEGTHVFEIDSQKVTCETAEFNTVESQTAASEELTVHPTYEDCTAFGFVEATVTTTGCNYVLNVNGDLDVACSGGPITISVFTCKVTVGSQELSGASYENVANGDVLVGAAVSGIAATKTDGTLCPLKGSGAGTATYNGDTLASGSFEGSPIDIDVN